MLEKMNAVLWAIATAMIIFFGIYFSIKLKNPQFRLGKIYRSLKQKDDESGISPLKTLALTLAGRIGVGSIAGVALAIYLGGPGSIFWMWVIALVSGSLAYVETMMAVKYKTKNKDGEDEGGPSYYIKNGFKSKKLALLYSTIVVFAYLIGFIPIQANTIAKSVDMYFNVSHIWIGIPIALISFIIIIGGIKKITKATAKIVPFMTFLYIILALTAVFTHLSEMPAILKTIVVSAFDFKPFFWRIYDGYACWRSKRYFF